jgi:hypothetical protein
MISSRKYKEWFIQPKGGELGLFTDIDIDTTELNHVLHFEWGECHKTDKHPLWAWIQLHELAPDTINYDYIHLYIPITINKYNPEVVGDINETEITELELFNIKTFIRGYYDAIMKHACGKVQCSFTFASMLGPYWLFNYHLNEGRVVPNKDFLFEMANYGKQLTGLPVNCWYVPKTNDQHSDRIKVQNNYANKVDYSDFIPFTLWGDYDITKVPDREIKLTTKTIKLVKKFIEYNFYNFSNANNVTKIKPEDIIKVDENGNPIYPKGHEFAYKVVRKLTNKNDYFMVQANNGLVNVINKNNNILSKEWFLNMTYFQNGIIPVQKTDGNWFRLFTNGDLKPYL